MEDWSKDVETILEQIRLNAIQMSNHHKGRYLTLKSYLKWFRIPTIVLSAVGVFAAVGLNDHLSNSTVSYINCGISLVTGLINSVELFMGIAKGMEVELASSKEFYVLATDIYKILNLSQENRMVSGRTFLDEKYQCYCKLVDGSILVANNIVDKLLAMRTEEDVDEDSTPRRVNLTFFTKKQIPSLDLLPVNSTA